MTTIADDIDGLYHRISDLTAAKSDAINTLIGNANFLKATAERYKDADPELISRITDVADVMMDKAEKLRWA